MRFRFARFCFRRWNFSLRGKLIGERGSAALAFTERFMLRSYNWGEIHLKSSRHWRVLMPEPSCDIALIGLAVMGQNIVLNMNDHGLRGRGLQPHGLARSTTSWPTRPRAPRSSARTRIEEMVAPAQAPAPRHADGQGRRAGRRVHRPPAAPLSKRATSSSTAATPFHGHHPPHQRPRGKGHSLRRHRRFRRRRRRAPRPVASCPAAIPRRGRTSRPSSSPSPPRWTDGDALLRLGRRRRRRPLRQDGPQRHRVRRHAAHLRGLPAAAARPRPQRRRAARACSPSGTRASSTAT